MTDPSIPEPLRRELVGELMDARRAVGAAKRASDALAERRARDRVQSAKVALGERGPKWWEGHDEADWRVRVKACLVTLLRARDPDVGVGPEDAARAAGGDDWWARLATAVEIGAALEADGRIVARSIAGADGVGAPDGVRLHRGPRFDA